MNRGKYTLLGALLAGLILASACAERVGLRYAFDQLKPEGYLVQPNLGFRSGDRFRIRVIPDQDCYVYVLHEGTDGRFFMLFPLGMVEGGKNWIEQDCTVQIPNTGNLALDNQPGVERVHIIASLAPVQFLEALRGRESQIQPDEFKAALKNLDISYKVAGAKWSDRGRSFTHEVIKNSDVLHCNVEMIHN